MTFTEIEKTSKRAELGGESHCLELLLHLFLSMRLIFRLTIGPFSEMRLCIYHKHQIHQVTKINDKPTKTSSAPVWLFGCRLMQAWVGLLLQIDFRGQYPLLGRYQGIIRKGELVNLSRPHPHPPTHWRAGSRMSWGNPLISANRQLKKPGRSSKCMQF